MKLPNHTKAHIPDSKITDYLLSLSHPYGRHKAAFLRSFGFSPDAPDILADALIHHAQQYEVTTAQDTPFGTRYTIEGELDTPGGRSPLIRAVWFIKTDSDVPLLVTVYPIRSRIK